MTGINKKFRDLRGKMGMSQVKLAEFLGMSPGSIYKYEKGMHTPRADVLEKMENYISEGVIKTNEEVNNMDIAPHNDMKERLNDKETIISYQKSEIESLKKRLKTLEDKSKILPLDTIYENTKPDFKTVVCLKNIFNFQSIERQIQSVDNPEVFADAIGMDVDTYLNKYLLIGKWHNSVTHPVNEIIHDDSLAELREATKSIPMQDKMFKFTFSSIYLKFTILYIYKGQSVFTNSFCKINWSTSPTVETKNVILSAIK